MISRHIHPTNYWLSIMKKLIFTSFIVALGGCDTSTPKHPEIVEPSTKWVLEDASVKNGITTEIYANEAYFTEYRQKSNEYISSLLVHLNLDKLPTDSWEAYKIVNGEYEGFTESFSIGDSVEYTDEFILSSAKIKKKLNTPSWETVGYAFEYSLDPGGLGYNDPKWRGDIEGEIKIDNGVYTYNLKKFARIDYSGSSFEDRRGEVTFTVRQDGMMLVEVRDGSATKVDKSGRANNKMTLVMKCYSTNIKSKEFACSGVEIDRDAAISLFNAITSHNEEAVISDWFYRLYQSQTPNPKNAKL
ncbi:hypothetical protein VCSRO82_2931 [Vibrio cholerae]|nr:hypothetical protein VCSRO108_2578 [Vibrio cholerae]GHZ89685.1 hypothetical protein VCSRO82_2931 [Vibrio cholerae]